MDKQQAQKIIIETFESSFDKAKFTGFVKNLLNRINDAPFTYQGNYIPDAYKQYIKTLERIGKFSDGKNCIDILVITLQKETSLERARTMQRNFIAWYLNGSRGGEKKNAALAAFVSPDEEDWRFSLVKMDYKFEKITPAKTKVKEEFTPARRWSFLVGKNEKSHTAQSRLVKILANDEQNPTLEELEKAFDIETVTKEFFLEYRELFLRTKEELDKLVTQDSSLRNDFEAKGVDTVNFAKKLLGQIIFLYFLQKKGWFGVGRDNDWGTGSKHFLRELFQKKKEYKNFFNDILEPLFYDALRRDRSDDDGYYKLFDCKIPFLNGGLFDPIGGNGGYSWVYTDILLPDKLFSNNVKTNKGDKGTGILDVFDRYNFTVKEDEPLEKEVAIDPELLGKVYEKFNAIRPDNFDEFTKALESGRKGEESKFNKKFGVYYTPREIVHFMCQQSLINYLAAEVAQTSSLSIPKKDIETLIHIGEHLIENEETALIKEQSIKDGKQKASGYKLKLPESIRRNAKLIDVKLAQITVCDPAVGSGAFPVGMMSEIVRARNVLSRFVKDKNRMPYEFKRYCIEHSIYGVDIDPGAVEIAKLRLWLSLIVDEDDIRNIRPLPNLYYKIMQGNSLISEFMGINFDSDKDKNNFNLSFKDETDELIELFQQKKDEFLNESNVTRKTKLKEEIDNLIIEIFETKLRIQKNKLKDIEDKQAICSNKEQWKEYLNQRKKKLYKESGFDIESAEKQLINFTSGRKIRPFFLWNLYFSEVFHNKSGFDVVIANPPYIGEKGNEKIFHEIARTELGKRFYSRWMDYFYYFFHKSIDICGENASIAFITTNYYLTATGAMKLRSDIKHRAIVKSLINFNELKIFESAKGQHNMLTILQKGQDSKAHVENCTTNRHGNSTPNILANIFSGDDNETYCYSFQQSELFEGIDHQIRIAGQGKNSSTPIEPVLAKMKSQPYRLGDICHILMGLVSRADKVNASHFKTDPNLKARKGDGIFILTPKELASIKLPKEDIAKYVRPFFKNSDISKYYCSSNNRFWLLYLKDAGKPITLSKEMKNHFSKYETLLTRLKENFLKNKIASGFVKRWLANGNYFVLFNPKKEIYFTGPKIIAPYRSKQSAFAYNELPWFASQDVCYILPQCSEFEMKYLLAILNSKLCFQWLRFKGKRKGDILELYKKPISEIPIKKISKNNQIAFVEVVDCILTFTKDEDYLRNSKKQAKVEALQVEIDQLVYMLYDLTPEEIRIVEGISDKQLR